MTRILVVDDEPQILRALQTSLRGAGYEVDIASTGEQALTAAAVRPPDAVILDLVLPDQRGTDVSRELRAWSSVPIIVLSVVGDEAEKVAALDAGADDYVTKPFGVDELLARLRAALRRAEPSGEPVLEIGALADRLRRACGLVRRQAGAAHAARVLAADAARAKRGQAAHAPDDPSRGLGARVRGRVALPPRLRLAAAAQARARPGAAEVHPHGARCRIPARRSLEIFLRRGLGGLRRG